MLDGNFCDDKIICTMLNLSLMEGESLECKCLLTGIFYYYFLFCVLCFACRLNNTKYTKYKKKIEDRFLLPFAANTIIICVFLVSMMVLKQKLCVHGISKRYSNKENCTQPYNKHKFCTIILCFCDRFFFFCEFIGRCCFVCCVCERLWLGG